MQYSGLEDFLKNGRDVLAKGPIALIFCEDEVEIATTLRHHLDCGFASVIALMPAAFALAQDVAEQVTRIDHEPLGAKATTAAVNALIPAAAGQWMFYCYNTEYLFFPFCEHRSIDEMLAFHTEERRDGMLTYVVDLYAKDLHASPNAVDLDQAFMDKTGYYALARKDPQTGHPKERQLDFFGGLRWRFEEHIPQSRRNIDRISLFRAQAGLKLGEDHSFNLEEYNTYSCPWHHNLTATLCSFRTAKALKQNPGSSFDIETFHWHNSVAFDWHSRQLLDLGLMEPGQWF
ncbi:MAG: hypothetical protein ACRBBS_13575 [Thalassovita sp.]